MKQFWILKMLYKASEVAQWVEVFVIKPDFDLQDPHKQKNMTRDLHICIVVHALLCTHIHIHIQKIKNIKQFPGSDGSFI